MKALIERIETELYIERLNLTEAANWRGVSVAIRMNSQILDGVPTQDIPAEVVGFDRRKGELTIKVAPRWKSYARNDILDVLERVNKGTAKKAGKMRVV